MAGKRTVVKASSSVGNSANKVVGNSANKVVGNSANKAAGNSANKAAVKAAGSGAVNPRLAKTATISLDVEAESSNVVIPRLSKAGIRAFLRWAGGSGKTESRAELSGVAAATNTPVGQPQIDPYQAQPISVRKFYEKGLIASGLIEDSFGQYKGNGKRLMLCPIHDDAKPSMGTLIDRDGTEVFHCLGCGAAGTVVDLAKRVARKFNYYRYPSPVEWVVRACSGYSGVKELVRFAGWYGEANQTSELVETDRLILSAANSSSESTRDIVNSYHALTRQGITTDTLKQAQKLLMVSLSAV